MTAHDREFYRNLSPFSDFFQLTNDANFAAVPNSWYVILTDIRGSTKAIQAGRYKDVNLIGAASVTCILNALNTYDIPFVFGGDGATLLVHKDDLSKVKEELENLQSLSQREFNLELRVGLVPVEKLYQLGAELRAGKYQLSPGNVTAQFRGNGLTLAEEMVKKGHPAGAELIKASSKESPHLEGLSCRLNPLRTKNGKILSLLIKPKDAGTLSHLLQSLQRILNNDFRTASPVTSDRLYWSWPPATLNSETKLQKRNTNMFVQLFKTAFNTLVLKICFTFNIPIGSFRPEKYKEEVITNSDFHKFDETLRMVIDCSEQQDNEIEKLLRELSQAHLVHYGLHRSQEAIMTCVVKSASENRHIHFIDGGDGGYALAALQFKKSLAKS